MNHHVDGRFFVIVILQLSPLIRTAVRKAREHLPDFVLLDLTMPTMDGLAATRIIKKELPSVRVVMLSQHSSAEFVHEAFAVGASGYVLTSSASLELIPPLRRIAGVW